MLGGVYVVGEWRLLIDSPKRNFKADLLHTDNEKLSMPVVVAARLKDSYNNIEILLSKIRFSNYQWSLCGDLKIIRILMRMQGGITNHCCFLWLWDSHVTAKHHEAKEWPARNCYDP